MGLSKEINITGYTSMDLSVNSKVLVLDSILPETNLIGQLYISGKQFHSVFWSSNSVCNFLIVLHKEDFTIIYHASCLWCVSNEILLV